MTHFHATHTFVADLRSVGACVGAGKCMDKSVKRRNPRIAGIRGH